MTKWTNLLNQQFTTSNSVDFQYLKSCTNISCFMKIFDNWMFLVPDRTFPPVIPLKSRMGTKTNFLKFPCPGGALEEYWQGRMFWLGEIYRDKAKRGGGGSCQYWPARRTKEIWGDFQSQWTPGVTGQRARIQLPTWLQIWKVPPVKLELKSTK